MRKLSVKDFSFTVKGTQFFGSCRLNGSLAYLPRAKMVNGDLIIDIEMNYKKIGEAKVVYHDLFPAEQRKEFIEEMRQLRTMNDEMGFDRLDVGRMTFNVRNHEVVSGSAFLALSFEGNATMKFKADRHPRIEESGGCF